MGDRCTGHCCKVFSLPASPAELKQRARWSRRHRLTGKLPGPASDRAPAPLLVEDIEQIATMAQPIGYSRNDPITGVEWLKAVHWYTCRNLDAAGNCTVYDTRPRMCREYPYGRQCQHKACAWGEATTATGPWPGSEPRRGQVPAADLEAKAKRVRA